MKKRLIRLTEGDLHRIVKESVRRIMNEVRDDSISDEEWDEIDNAYNDSGLGDDRQVSRDLEKDFSSLDWEDEQLRSRGDSIQNSHPQVDSGQGAFLSTRLWPAAPESFRRKYLDKLAKNSKKIKGF